MLPNARKALLIGGLLFSTTLESAAQQSGWPSVEQQLKQDKVVPGSALEKLIIANQEVGLLAPSEQHDRAGLPLWLRVLWHKRHPDGRHAESDPSGGYPLVLRDYYEWMRDHQDLKRGEAPPRTSSSDANASGEQRISGAQLSSRGETSIRVNRYNQKQVVAASKNLPPGAAQGLSGAQMAIFYSGDGGLTWGQSYLPWVSGDNFMGDPSVDWTSDGTAWASVIAVINHTDLVVRVYKSTDAGATWTYDANLLGGDKELMWDSPEGSVFVAHRTGPKGSWQTPVWLPVPAIGTDIKTNSRGDVFAFLPAHMLYKSTDGGVSFSGPVTIAKPYALWMFGVPANNNRMVLDYTVGAAYRTASRDDVYVAWTDLSGEVGCTTASDAPGSNAASPCKTRIFFSRSTDGGATWSTPAKVSDAPGLNDQFLPWLVVDEASGGLALSYSDTIGNASRTSVDVYYQSSADHGQTWSLPFKVTTAPTNETSAGASWFQFGDYSGMDGVSGLFFPVWTDRRSGGPEEIWTTAILDSSAPCVPPATPTGLSAVRNGPTGINLAWNASPDAAQYSVLRATVSGGPYTTVATPQSSGLIDAGIACATSFYYRVTAASLYCPSSGSSEVSATTGACVDNLGFYALPPCRLLDTRGGAPLASGVARLLSVAGKCGIPADAKVLSTNLTIIEPQGEGDLQIYPGDGEPPATSALSFSPRQSASANNAMVLLAGNGSATFNALVSLIGTTNLVVDVNGYFK
jgi:hypothetical protein